MTIYIILSVIVLYIIALEYRIYKQFDNLITNLQIYLKIDKEWTNEVYNRLTEIDKWIKEHDNTSKN